MNAAVRGLMASVGVVFVAVSSSEFALPPHMWGWLVLVLVGSVLCGSAAARGRP